MLAPLLLVALLIKSPHRQVLFGLKEWGNMVNRSSPKFRTMISSAPLKATEELENPERYITKLGRILRITSIDELPQLYCVLTGKMSLVGPRPVLTSK